MTQLASQKNTILITGAARRIGAALAEHFAARGHDLVLHYHRSAAEAEALAERLRAQVTVTLVQADLADSAALTRFWNGLPPVTHLIHNASMFERDTLATMPAEQLRLQLAVNLEAPLLLSQGFMAQLPGPGSITVLGDGCLGWSIGAPFFSYAVSKHAWASVIELLAAAVAPQARANLVSLAPTLPGVQDNDTIYARLAERAPLKRNGTPEEICAAVEYLLGAPGVTGQNLSLANGFGLAIARPLSTAVHES